MKAVVYHSYGSPEVLQVTQLPKPDLTEDGILVKIVATTVSAGDWRLRKADPFLARIFNGLFRPKRINVLGFELAGIIESTGKNVTKFKAGEAILAHCGLQFGGYAEYRLFRETDLIIRKPENITFEEAAASPVGGTTALKLLEKVQFPKNGSLLIHGASGSVGSFCVQLARYYGYQVTAVCSNENKDWVQQLGADRVIDYTSQPIAKWGKFDAVIDAVGTLKSAEIRRLLKKGGKIATVRSQYKIKQENLAKLTQLLAAGVVKPVIDRTYTLDTIREAHSYVESMRKKGNVIVRVEVG